MEWEVIELDNIKDLEEIKLFNYSAVKRSQEGSLQTRKERQYRNWLVQADVPLQRVLVLESGYKTVSL